jgi:hypothetical protein
LSAELRETIGRGLQSFGRDSGRVYRRGERVPVDPPTWQRLQATAKESFRFGDRNLGDRATAKDFA